MNSQKNKGDKAEREAAELLSEKLPWKARRKLGAGRMDDVGDLEIDGCPECVIQVADWSDKSKACLQKPREAEMQRWNAKAKYAASMIRWRGGHWRIVMTVDQFARLLTAAVDE
tara:strand:+ start:137 stop:478 length:342 start_codon:yes stop_codon:yes gene_type:complete